MNEEIQVKFGGDLTPLGTSLRSLNKMVKDAGKEAGESLKEGFGSLGSILSGGAILAGIKGVIDHFDELDKRAKNLSISTDFLQGMEHISSNEAIGGTEAFDKSIAQLSVNLGEAKDGVTEAQAKFERWGISLKDIQDLNTEQMFYKLSDVIKAIPDPAERSAAAFDLLGKSGKNMAGLLANGSEDVKKMVDAVDKLDADKIKQLADAKKDMEDLSNKGTILAGKAIAGVSTFGHWLGNVSTGDLVGRNDYEDSINRKLAAQNAAPGATPGPDQTVMAKQAAELMAAKNRYMDAKNGVTDEGKMTALVRDRHDLQERISAMQGESVEKYKLMAEAAEKDNAITELNAKIKKEAADKQAKTDVEHKKHLEEEKTLTLDISKTRHELENKERERARDKTSEYMPSLEELANSGYSYVSGSGMKWQQGPFAAQARELMNLQSDAKQSLIWGNKDRFSQDTSRIDELKKSLSDAGVMSPDDRLKSIDEGIEDSKTHLADLLAKANGDGIKVVGPDD